MTAERPCGAVRCGGGVGGEGVGGGVVLQEECDLRASRSGTDRDEFTVAQA